MSCLGSPSELMCIPSPVIEQQLSILFAQQKHILLAGGDLVDCAHDIDQLHILSSLSLFLPTNQPNRDPAD